MVLRLLGLFLAAVFVTAAFWFVLALADSYLRIYFLIGAAP